LTESGVIAQFLADLVPGSHLLPPSNTPDGALFRARVGFFVDTWNTKIGNFMFSLFRAQTPAESEKMSQEWVAAVRKEIEPLLADAGPFFGGQSRVTLAEVST
jgi:glutathione S-transferase